MTTDKSSEQRVEEALEIADGSVSHWFDGPFIGDGIDWTTRPHAENCAGCVIETLAAAVRDLTARLSDKTVELDCRLEDIADLTDERDRLREALSKHCWQYSNEAGWEICAACNETIRDGHARDCAVLAALNPTQQG